MNKKIFGVGATLATVALIPTPDDVTIISPVVQLVLGGLFMTVGAILPDKK